MSPLPAPGQIVDAWWPCDRCAGLSPGVDFLGHELFKPPVKLVNGEYLCGPCRGLSVDDALKHLFDTAA